MVDVFNIFLKDVTVFPPRSISQLKTQLFLKFIIPIRPTDGITFRGTTIYFGTSSELIHSKIIRHPGSPLGP